MIRFFLSNFFVKVEVILEKYIIYNQMKVAHDTYKVLRYSETRK